jgi:hypothetical protein
MLQLSAVPPPGTGSPPPTTPEPTRNLSGQPRLTRQGPDPIQDLGVIRSQPVLKDFSGRPVPPTSCGSSGQDHPVGNPRSHVSEAPAGPYGLVVGWWGIEHDHVTVSKHHRAPTDPYRTACRDPPHPHSGPSDIRREVRQEAWPPHRRVPGRGSPEPGRERHMPVAPAQGRSQQHSRQPAGSHSVCRSRRGCLSASIRLHVRRSVKAVPRQCLQRDTPLCP